MSENNGVKWEWTEESGKNTKTGKDTESQVVEKHACPPNCIHKYVPLKNIFVVETERV